MYKVSNQSAGEWLANCTVESSGVSVGFTQLAKLPGAAGSYYSGGAPFSACSMLTSLSRAPPPPPSSFSLHNYIIVQLGTTHITFGRQSF